VSVRFRCDRHPIYVKNYTQDCYFNERQTNFTFELLKENHAVCGLGEVGSSLVFGLVRGVGTVASVLPSFVLVSNMPFTEHNRGFATSFRGASSFRREAIVGGALARASAFRVGLGVSGAVIVSGSCACPSHLWMSHVLTSSLSLGSSSLFLLL
jgi:hypothetical protein